MRRSKYGAAVFTLAVWLGLPPALHAQSRPTALQEFEQRRGMIRTAQIELSFERPRLATNERMKADAGIQFATSRIGNQDTLLVQRGGPDGIIMRTESGEASENSQTPIQYLRRDRELWDHQQDSLVAQLWPLGAGFVPLDFRSLGAGPQVSPAGIHEALWFDGTGAAAPREYSEETEDGITVISAKTNSQTIRWWLDPKLDWNPIRTATFDEKGVVAELRLTYKKFDDIWFPETVASFSRDFKDGKEPGELIRVIAATFNRPEHPQRLTPADLGMEPGINVMKYDEKFMPLGTHMYDGTTAVPVEEYNRRVKAGEIKPGPRVLAGFEKVKHLPINLPSKVGAPAGGEREDAWRRFTREFIEEYSLNAEQIQRAWAICGECEDRRDAFLSKEKSSIQKAQEAVAAASAAKPGQRDLREQAELQLARLLRPVDEIFEEQLKPRLEKLPTRAQRAAAEARESAVKETRKDKGSASPK